MTVLILLLCLSGCSNKDKQAFYGTYTFDKVSYLSPLSSSTIGFVNEYFKGSKYTIETDLFKIETPDSTFEIKSPNYVKETIPDDINELSNVRSFIGNDEVEYQYTIYNNDGNKTYWRLYISSDCVWIARYQDNLANGSDIIMNIYKLSS
jgi:hypothetical protein